jgi:Tfp pilus assembly protein PilO
VTRRNILVIGGACALVLLAWYMLLWSPKGADLTAAKEQRAKADDQVAELRVRVERLEDARRTAPALIASQDRLRSAVPDTPDLAGFLLDANRAATETGVDFLSITPSVPTASVTPGVPTEIPLQISIRGGYFQTLGYLDRLLTLRRVVVVDGLTLVPDQESQELGVNLTARMFTSELPAGAVAAPAPPSAATDGAPPVTTTSTTAPREARS